MMRFLTIVFTICVVVGLTLSWMFGSIVTGRADGAAPPLPAGASSVKIVASDGIKIAGHYWRGSSPSAPAILMLHGLGGSRAQFDQLGPAMVAKGYAVLAINLRGHGDSGGDLRSFGLFEARDAHAAFDWLKAKQSGAKVGLAGLSLGGAAALIGPDGPVPADALALTVVYPDIRSAIRNRIASRVGSVLASIGEPLLSYQSRLRFGVWPSELSPLSAVGRATMPIFVIGGEADMFTPAKETRAIFDAVRSPKRLWIVPGADHNATPSHSDYDRRIGAFFDETLQQSP
jgi:uncharacterized protein